MAGLFVESRVIFFSSTLSDIAKSNVLSLLGLSFAQPIQPLRSISSIL